MADLLGLSVTGLRVAQSALSTTGHNIANAGTDGYSRQRIDAVTNNPIFEGSGYVGNGASVRSIDRVANDFVVQQLRIDSTLNSDLETYFDQVSQLDNLLSDEATGLTGALQTFFSAIQNGADDPTSIPARQLIISQAENLSDRFNSIDARMRVLEEGVKDGLEVAVSQVNALVNSIAELNSRITDAKGLSSSSEPNDLLDQRDEALRQLSELVPIQTFEQGQGQVNVVIASGQSLIVGNDVRTVSIEPSSTSGIVDTIVVRSGDEVRDITDGITGGEVGALLRFRDEVLYPAYNSLGRIAVVVGQQFNETHQKGVTLENEFGSLFFNDINDTLTATNRVLGHSENAPPADRQMALYVNDINQLSESDYRVVVEREGLFSITRLSDNAQVTTGLFPGGFPFSVEFDGLELEFSGGTFSVGDEFILQPTRNAAAAFSREIGNPEDIAFASPLLTDADIGNTGSGVISPGAVESLVDENGDPLTLLGTAGEMNPPLVVVFTSPTTYDILDNTDPADPQQLDPPIRNQQYIPGVSNSLFPGTEGQTQVSSNGEMIGLPEGRSAVSQSYITPNFVNPPDPISGVSQLDFTVTDFSGVNQFSFDVAITDTINGVGDSSTTVTVNSSVLTDENALLTHINNQLGGTRAEAYIAIAATGERTLAFAVSEPGYGNVTVGNYAGPGNGTADALLNISIEGGATYTSVGDADGVSGTGTLNNNYPAEKYTISLPAAQEGLPTTDYEIFSSLHGSARELASQLSNVPGVEANASTYAEINSANFAFSEPAQIKLNGVELIRYNDELDGIGEPLDPTATTVRELNAYLADQINTHAPFQTMGIYALAAQDPISGDETLRIYSAEGDDLQFGFSGNVGESIEVSDGQSGPVTLDGVGNHVASSVVVGGLLDVRMDKDITLTTRPTTSMLFGDTTDPDFVESTYLGITAELSGVPDTGDRFTLDFNIDAKSDNRNALDMIEIEQARLMDGETTSLFDAYGSLVETAGIEANTAKINSDAAKAVLEQTTALRNSISGVNLDEEAANLIKYEQFFQANAQVISVARSLFDTLIGSF